MAHQISESPSFLKAVERWSKSKETNEFLLFLIFFLGGEQFVCSLLRTIQLNKFTSGYGWDPLHNSAFELEHLVYSAGM